MLIACWALKLIEKKLSTNREETETNREETLEDMGTEDKFLNILYYVHSSPIYNSQKLERTQMSLSGGMDTKNVVYLYNGVLLFSH